MSAVHKTTLADFVPLGKLGTGSFSSVYKVRRVTDDTVYALKKIKLMSLKQKQIQNALNQISILSSIESKSVIAYKESFFDEKLNLLCLVMELATDGDLAKKIQYQKKKNILFGENQIWKMIKNIVSGLQSLHNASILHRDIKCANIFICKDSYKLGDMNVSKIQQDSGKLAHTQTGTPNYASPEVWRDQPYDSKSDIWSLGCVIYQMCTFKPPFKGSNLDQLYKSVQKGHYQQISPNYSGKLKKFIAKCLNHNPADRPSCQELLEFANNQRQGNSLKSHRKTFSKGKVVKEIKIPKNMKQLNKSLPQSRYESENNIPKFLSIQLQSPFQCQQIINPQSINSKQIKKIHLVYEQNLTPSKKISFSQSTNKKVNQQVIQQPIEQRNIRNLLKQLNSPRQNKNEEKKNAHVSVLHKDISDQQIKNKQRNESIDNCRFIKGLLQKRASINQSQKKLLSHINSICYINNKTDINNKKQNLTELNSPTNLQFKNHCQTPSNFSQQSELKTIKKMNSYSKVPQINVTPRLSNMIKKVEHKQQFSYLNCKVKNQRYSQMKN